jgi:hypothetical protein
VAPAAVGVRGPSVPRQDPGRVVVGQERGGAPGVPVPAAPVEAALCGPGPRCRVGNCSAGRGLVEAGPAGGPGASTAYYLEEDSPSECVLVSGCRRLTHDLTSIYFFVFC